MAKKEKWEEKYEAFKKYDKVEDLEKQDLGYRKQLANIKDQNSPEYKEISKKRKDIDKQKKAFSQIKKNIPMVEKIKERRDVYQEMLDELMATMGENEKMIQKRIDLDNESKKLDSELNEINELIDSCKEVMKSDKESEENKALAAKMLKYHQERKDKNQLRFSDVQKALEKELANPLKQVPQNDIKELRDNIKKDNKACEMLMEGKTMTDVIAEQRKTSEKSEKTKPENAKPTNAQPTNTEPVKAEQASAQPTNTEPENAEPENAEPASTESTNAEPTNAEPVKAEQASAQPTNTEPVNTDPANPTPTNAEPANAEPASVELGKAESAKGKSHKKIVSVEVEDDKYTFVYEVKENGVYSKENEEAEKLGFFKALKERASLIVHRKEYGVNLRSAFRADVNITANLKNDKDKDKYLNYLAGQTDSCFDIRYDNPKSRYAKALVKGQEKLALKESKALEQYGPQEEVDADIIHDLQQSKYDNMFGPGFDQHENPPKLTNEENTVQEEVAQTVGEILNESEGR